MSSILRVDSIQTAAGGSATASSLGIGGVGKLGQVVEDTEFSVTSTTSTSFVQLGDTLSITPKFSTSKIFITAGVRRDLSGSGNTAYFDFGRTTGGTTTQNIGGVSGGIFTMNDISGWRGLTYTFLDSPSTTSVVAYFCSVKVSAGTLYFNDNSANNLTNFTLMEIAQ